MEHCPISSALIDRAIAAILTLGRAGGFPQDIREIEFFADAADECLMLELYLQPGAHMSRRDLRSFFDRLREHLPEAATLAMFPPSAPRSAQGREQMIAVVVGDPGLTYSAAGFQFRVSPGAFFQTNRFMTEKLVELVATGHTGNSALDLYAGVGLFALPLARSFATVTAVEAAPASADDLAHNVPPNVRAVAGTAEEFLAGRSVPQPDYIVVDPPRAGLGARVTSAIARMAPAAITYVSCDPSTLARDLKLLLAAGYRLTGIDLVDLFPQTFHIESVVQLSRT